MIGLLSVLLWLASIVASVALTALLNDPIQWLVVRLFAGAFPPGPRSIQGTWQAKYTYFTSTDIHARREEEQIIDLYQLGLHVWGRNRTGQRHWYKLRGSLDQEVYFTGLWQNRIERNIYHGAFQLVLDSAGNSMKGKWIGFNNRHQINHGPWEWKRVPKPASISHQ